MNALLARWFSCSVSDKLSLITWLNFDSNIQVCSLYFSRSNPWCSFQQSFMKGMMITWLSHVHLVASQRLSSLIIREILWRIHNHIVNKMMLILLITIYRDWLKHPKSYKTKVGSSVARSEASTNGNTISYLQLWALSLKVLMPSKRNLTSFQHVLPKYPLPKLSDTCKR